MQDFEKLGLFYLGRRYDLAGGRLEDELVLYDSRDLLTHAVCVGMTGSGKTGLCLGLVEEAAIDGVPVIAIDPKGDISNLLLSFPRLAPEDFRPWIDDNEARRLGVDPQAHAAAQARMWGEGLAAWGQDGARIQRLRDSADFCIYTPGSRAGHPVSILRSFEAPPAAARDDAELLAERAGNLATSVLALAGVDAPPRSREHSLVASVLGAAWKEGRDLDLAELIRQVQTPPFTTVGVVDLESFFPARERFELAMRLNGLLAAPGFEQWLEGAPLDPSALLHAADGRPRVAIFSIAHLGDAERMFFVSLLLNQIVGWMRRQSGTGSLRAILYIDEVLGYFPPVANPPSKAPLLTLLKQGRGFGLGVVLATQNPVDLDYKGLGNTGTWFLGRLQTDRDKQRLLDGLEGAAAGALDRRDADRILSMLGKRVFLLHNVHEPAPVVFQTRWTLSYLRGPLSRDQIRILTRGIRPAVPERPAEPLPSGPGRGGPSRAVTADEGSVATTVLPAPPVVPPGIPQWYLPARGDTATYRPVALGVARITFRDAKLGIEETRDVVYAAEIGAGAVALDWSHATRLDAEAASFQRSPMPEARFAPVPEAALGPRNYAAWEKSFGTWLAQSQRIELLRHPESKLTSRSGEPERDFRIRVQEAQRAARDQAVDDVRRKYAPKQTQLAEQLRRAEAGLARETQQASHAKIQTAVSMGATLLGALLGRKAVSTGTLGRATTAARGVGRSRKEAEDIKRASESVEAVRSRAQQLEEEIREETRRIAARFEAAPVIERLPIAPKRGQVAVRFVALGWIPLDSPVTRP